MKKTTKIFTIIALICLLACLAGILTACGSRFEVSYQYWYYHTNSDGSLSRYSLLGKLSTDNAEDNVLAEDLTILAPPVGHTFGGYRTSDGTKIFDENLVQVPGVKLSSKIKEIYPIWNPITYTFLFAEKVVDGVYYINESKSIQQTIGKNFDIPYYIPEPYEANKSFIGWSGNPDYPDCYIREGFYGIFELEHPWNEYYKPVTSYVDQNGTTHTGNFIIMTALFGYTTHKVELFYNRSLLPSVYLQIVNGDTLPDLSEYSENLNGKHVYGWSTSMVEYIPYTGPVTQSMTLHAMWEQYHTVNLHYAPNNIGTMDVYEVTETVLPTPSENKEYHTFGGWYDNSSYSGSPITHPTYNGDVTNYYAKWNPVSFPVSYVTNGGNDIAEGSYLYGNGMALPTPEKYQCKFLGWYTDEALTAGPIFELPKDAHTPYVLYAKWTESKAVSTKEELLSIANDPTAGYYLTCDINLEGEAWTPIPSFSGILEGNGYAIKNFSLQSSSATDGYAFIVENRGTVQNLTLKDMSIGYYNVKHAGVLTAKNYGLIDNCHVISKAVDTTACALQYNKNYTDGRNHIYDIFMAGAITAYNDNAGKIVDCSASTPIKITYNANNTADGTERYMHVSNYVGAICGQNKGEVSGCTSSREIDVVGNSYCDNGRYNTLLKGELQIYNHFYFGGVVGANEEGATLSKCSSSVKLSNNVTISGNGYAFLRSTFGGLVGYNGGKLTASYTENAYISGNFVHYTMDVVGVGGLVGRNAGTGEIANCYTKNFSSLALNITTGGLVAINQGIIQTSYVADALLKVEASGAVNWYIGGFVGYNHTTASVKNSICRSTTNLSSDSAMSQHFAGDSVGVMMSCYVSDASKRFIGGAEQDFFNDDAHATTVSDSTIFSHDFLVDDLYWNESVWSFEDSLPTLK